ncbi:hypothetical protein LCGC14_0399550 [marine sediment metagenome]|uniref:Uncharacterized protein n=1 Tax=marine sediment metagenome TaxID=412755 RepID=A0A0F9W653_9ZZZZ
MADRSWSCFKIPWLYADDPNVKGILGCWERLDAEAEGHVEFVEQEVAGGGCTEEEDLVLYDIPFHHTWAGVAGVYSDEQSVFLPGEGIAHAAEDGPVAAVGPRGAVNKRDIKFAIRFHRLKRLFDRMCKRGK